MNDKTVWIVNTDRNEDGLCIAHVCTEDILEDVLPVFEDCNIIICREIEKPPTRIK